MSRAWSASQLDRCRNRGRFRSSAGFGSGSGAGAGGTGPAGPLGAAGSRGLPRPVGPADRLRRGPERGRSGLDHRDCNRSMTPAPHPDEPGGERREFPGREILAEPADLPRMASRRLRQCSGAAWISSRNRQAIPDGTRRPCSQDRTVLTSTPRNWPKIGWLTPIIARIPLTSSGPNVRGVRSSFTRRTV